MKHNLVKIKEWIHNHYQTILFWIVMVIAILSRFIGIEHYPGGIHVDEAYAGYESWSLLNYGYDSWGYKNPVYLLAWGSGMNALDSYLMMPFIAIGGLNRITIRLPQVIIGCLSVWVVFLLLKKVKNIDIALVGMFIIAICPWHVMMSRWGLESNLAPGLLLFASYFFILGLEKRKMFIPSAVFFGLSLYCYALIWILVPSILLFWGLYGIVMKKIHFSRELIIACLILGVLACPLMLFIFINKGWLPEILSSFISIPKLAFFRMDEVGFNNWIGNTILMIMLYIKQDDGMMWNAISGFGMYYMFSLPFIILGGIITVVNAVKDIIHRKFSYSFILIIYIVVAVIMGIIQSSINMIHINYLHISVLLLLVTGIYFIFDKNKKAFVVLIGVYVCSFIFFQIAYYTDFQEAVCMRQQEGADEVLDRALELCDEDKKICIPRQLRHSQVLFYTEWPTDNFINTVVWVSETDRYRSAKSFGPFLWDEDERNELDCDNIYIFSIDEIEKYNNMDKWSVEVYDDMGIAYKNKDKHC